MNIDKTIYQLINETEATLRKERIERESKLKEENDQLKTRELKSNEENQELKKMKSSNEKEIQRLQNKLQQQSALLEQEKQKGGSSTQFISSLGHRLMDKTEITDSLKRENGVYQTLVQAKSNEINLLNQIHKNIEKENQELKRKLEECQLCSQPLVDNNNSTNNNNSNTTINNTIELDNQVPLSDAPDRSVDNIRVKIETEPENDSSPSCQIGNKKRKVSSNDS